MSTAASKLLGAVSRALVFIANLTKRHFFTKVTKTENNQTLTVNIVHAATSAAASQTLPEHVKKEHMSHADNNILL